MERAESITRRGLLRAAAGTAMATLASQAQANDPPKRSGAARLRLSLAAYSYRDYLTGKAAPNMTLPDFVNRAAAMNLDAVELTEYYFPKPVTPEFVLSLKKQCYLLGLDISGSPVGNTFTLPPGSERDKQLGHVQQWIDTAALLGAPCIRIFAGDQQKGQTLEEAQKYCVECIEICCERAAQKGVLLAIENHGGIVAEADSLLTIIKAVQSEWCGINLDTGNFRTADPYGDMAKCAPYAVSVQLKTEIQPKGQPKREADLARELKILKSVGYRGYLTLEYEAQEEPLKAVPRYIEKLRALL